MLRITLLLCLAAGTLAAIRLPPPCPSVTAVTDFDALQIAGKWYAVEDYSSILQSNPKCVTVEYLPKNNGTITVVVSETRPFTGRVNTITGLARPAGKTTEANYNATFQTLLSTANFSVALIGTDYNNFSVYWSCDDHEIYSTQNAWLLTRERNPSQETLQAAYAVFDAQNISRRYLSEIDQTDC